MRLRKVKNALERLKQNDNKYFVENPEEYKGKWHELFNNSNPIHIEIGCGKGKFISELASKNPDINYIAIEKSFVSEYNYSVNCVIESWDYHDKSRGYYWNW